MGQLSLQILPNRFQAAGATVLNSVKAQKTETPHIRRPTRGIQITEDTFATIRVVTSDGRNLLMVDAGSNRRNNDQSTSAQFFEIDGKRATYIYSNFLLQQIAEERSEKAQILETFGEPFIFIFGERARVVNFQGILANTFDFNWEAEWWYNYENYLRGTRCVELGAQVFISYDHTLIGGYILSCSSTKVATERNYVTFQFQLFVTSYTQFSAVGVPTANTQGLNVLTQLSTTDLQQLQTDLAPFQPVLVPEIGAALRSYNAGTMPTLAQGLIQSAIGSVTNALNTVNQVTNQTLQTLSNILSGDVVRVPVGFAGDMVFSSGLSELSASQLASDFISVDSVLPTVGKFGTFDLNSDEYVGSGDQYGSANAAVLQYLQSPTVQTVLAQGTQLQDAASSTWADAGLTVPTTQESPVGLALAGAALRGESAGATAALAGNQYGILPVGSANSWRTTKSPGPGFPASFASGGLTHSSTAPAE